MTDYFKYRKALIEQACLLIQTMIDIDHAYDAINKALKNVEGEYGDFPTHITPMPSRLEIAVVELLDMIIPDQTAGYLLYETRNMPDGGKITLPSGKEFNIRDASSVREYALFVLSLDEKEWREQKDSNLQHSA